MSSWKLLTFMLITVSCYALSTSKPLRNDQQKPMLSHMSASSFPSGNQHQSSNALKVEARHKRSQREWGDYKDLSDIIEELEDNSIVQAVAAATATASQELDTDSIQPLTYYLLLQKLKQLQGNEPTYRVRTPRLGRSIDFQLMDAAGGGGGVSAAGDEDMGASRQFVSRVIKKSVPFKPRLGKRGQTCE